MVIVDLVSNILDFFLSPTPHSLSFSLSALSLVLSHPQSTDHQYPTYGDHCKSSELSRTTKLKVRKKRSLIEINRQTTEEEAR